MSDETQDLGPAIEIKGGAGPHEAAAIAAAVHQALADEDARRSKPPKRPRLPAWITVMRSHHPGRPDPD